MAKRTARKSPLGRKLGQAFTGKRKWLALGLAGGAAYLLFRGGGGSETVKLSSALKLEPVKAGEQISIGNHYRVIGARREGMTYAPVIQRSGNTLTFDVPVDGKFTRNFVDEGGRLSAEIKG